MRTNTQRTVLPHQTHEGGLTAALPPLAELRRAVMACLLFENTFYESGVDIAARIHTLAAQCKPEDVAALSIEARTKQGLRHAPLWLALGLVGKYPVSTLLPQIIKRPDELGEFLSLYWKGKRTPIAAQIKKGLRTAFSQFSAYQLAKYASRDGIKLRDVMFMVHAKPPKDLDDTYKQLAEGTLNGADTWEVAISAAGSDPEKKKAEWNRLLENKKLGYVALLRNLRNLNEAGANQGLVEMALVEGAGNPLIWPLQFAAALKAAPMYAAAIHKALGVRLAAEAGLPGHTVVLVDVSGSMNAPLSAKSTLTRLEAATSLAATCKGESVRVFSFSDRLQEVPNFGSLATADALKNSQPHSGTALGAAIHALHSSGATYDRLVIITDEQTNDQVPNPSGKGYIINVASNQYGIGYGPWTHITGFSQSAWAFIAASETN